MRRRSVVIALGAALALAGCSSGPGGPGDLKSAGEAAGLDCGSTNEVHGSGYSALKVDCNEGEVSMWWFPDEAQRQKDFDGAVDLAKHKLLITGSGLALVGNRFDVYGPRLTLQQLQDKLGGDIRSYAK